MAIPVCAKPIWWVCCQKALFQFHLTTEASPICSSSCVWQLNTLAFVFGWAYFGGFLPPRLNCFLQFSSCDHCRVFSLSNSPPHRALGQYRHTSSSRQICNIFSWLEPLSYYTDGGNEDFQCVNSFITATFYFAMLNNLVLHIRNILLFLRFYTLLCVIKGIWPLCSSYL